jgi:branched-chain amino acid transport system ATP-binding protein
MTAILEARDVTMRFGGLVANERVSLSVRPGEIFAVIGPNGAGKTTLFNAITGIYEPTEGEVLFEGRPIRREWGMSDRVKGLAVGLVSAAVAVLALNASALWQGAIVDRYVYGEAFPWGEALDSVPRTLRESGFWLTWFAAAVGFAVARLGFGAIWKAQRRTPDLVARAGVARTFQNIRLFGAMTALENLMVAQHNRLMVASGFSLLGLFGAASFRAAERAAIDKARYWLDRTGLVERADWEAANLPYGDQRRLEIARAMCTDPALLCLDEPAAGLNPRESAELNGLLRFIRDTHNVAVLLIEHDMSVVMEISDHVVVLDYGRKIASGSPEAVRNDPAVIRAYLGEGEDAALPAEIAADLGAQR